MTSNLGLFMWTTERLENEVFDMMRMIGAAGATGVNADHLKVRYNALVDELNARRGN